MTWSRYPKYISVAERKEMAEKKIKALKKKGQELNPITITKRTIAATFWGQSWCKHLESYSDYENRLPRGRSYVRNGSILDLKISQCQINALVQGSRLYTVSVEIKPVIATKWQTLKLECSGKIDSLIELLQGKFSKSVMEIITDKEDGLFPDPHEIKLNCSCPDWATMCKHVAAVLYGIGARLDEKPEELFTLRDVDHLELINASNTINTLTKTKKASKGLEDSDLSSLFDIDIEDAPQAKKASTKKKAKKETKKKVPAKVRQKRS